MVAKDKPPISSGEKIVSPDNNGWDTWAKHVLAQLEDNKEDHKSIKDDLEELKTAIAVLKVKSGVWGALAGLVAALGALAIGALSWFQSKQ